MAMMLAACDARPEKPKHASLPLLLPEAADQEMAEIERQQQAMLRLEEQISYLEQRLAAQGRGAYRQGSSLNRDTQQTTVLDRLHALEQHNEHLRESLNTYQHANQELHVRLRESEERSQRLRTQQELLRGADQNLLAAQQEREDLRLQLEKIREHLASAEVERLRSERRYFDLVREIITLRSDETQRLLTLQSRLRGEALVLRPADVPQNPTGQGALRR